ncbi:MAG TPA: hypothetical protein VHI93_03980 [Candidatus Thermoplasmatota archaeon]|nr:hypothetical protein [Candidatus Thermoplasmatota archaeon]
MSLDAHGWVVTDGKGRFLARGGVEGEAWVEDAAQALVFRELWAAQAHRGIALPWTTAMQVAHPEGPAGQADSG